ncbi:MAG TPA: GGDEF domain-containing protein [Desulfobacteraceae bacterium]|nr:GGDEF domain-containing protein [Desulfobacteraceae bacterium]
MMYRNWLPDTVAGRIRLYSILMACLPLLFVVIVLFFFIRNDTIADAQRTLVEQSESHKLFIEEWFQGRKNDAAFLAQLPAVRQGDLEQCRHIFKAFDETHEDISAVVMVGPNGKTVVNSIDSAVVDVSDRKYFIRARAGHPHVTKVITGRASGQPIIIFSHPLTRADGTFSGLVFLASRLTAINALMNNLRFGSTGETYILNREGYMLTESRYLDQLKSEGRVSDTAVMQIKTNAQILGDALAGLQPQGPYADYRGARVLGASQWTKGGSWLIVSEIDYAEAIRALNPFLAALLGGFIITLVCLIPVLLRLTHSISQPLELLNKVTRDMAAGKFQRSGVDLSFTDAPKEVGQLVDTFSSMHTRVEETLNRLEEAAVTDQLTGLPNRRFLMEEGARIVSIAVRAKQPCSLFMMDIDHFKKINDTYGHVVGDSVLKQIADALNDIARSTDIVARYGGEEFAVVAPGADMALARNLAERLRQGIASMTFNTDERPISCTVSIGIADNTGRARFGADEYEDMLARADKALYHAKTSGRNAVRAYGDTDALGLPEAIEANS